MPFFPLPVMEFPVNFWSFTASPIGVPSNLANSAGLDAIKSWTSSTLKRSARVLAVLLTFPKASILCNKACPFLITASYSAAFAAVLPAVYLFITSWILALIWITLDLSSSVRAADPAFSHKFLRSSSESQIASKGLVLVSTLDVEELSLNLEAYLPISLSNLWEVYISSDTLLRAALAKLDSELWALSFNIWFIWSL